MKRAYNKLATTKLELILNATVLTGSIVSNSLISSVGQELGPSYDLSSDFDSNTGKTFSHEWEAGSF